jgi:hypothetical protein
MSSTSTGRGSASRTAPDPKTTTILRSKTAATRLSIEELEEAESAAKRVGKSLAEWLRDIALREARQLPADPLELILSEVAANRYMLLNLFHATALANGEGKHLQPDSVLRIRETADARKFDTARKMLQDFLAQDGLDADKK